MIHWRVKWFFVTYIPWSILVSCNGGVWIPGTASAIAHSQSYSLFIQWRRKKAQHKIIWKARPIMREGRGKRIEWRFGFPAVGRGREKVWVAWVRTWVAELDYFKWFWVNTFVLLSFWVCFSFNLSLVLLTIV